MKQDNGKPNEDSEDCEFCHIVARSAPAEVVYETGSSLAFFPLNPATKGHTLVVPKTHVRDFLDADARTYIELNHAVLKVGHALQEVFSPDGMNVITSAGEAASQTVTHLHIHLVPRWVGDPVGDIWPPQQPTSVPLMTTWAEEVRRHCSNESLKERNPKQS
jgi:histidine triad (HIT) family protein